MTQLPSNPAKAQVQAFLASRELLETAYFESFQECLTECLTKMPKDLSTARAHAFLSSRYKPALSLGVAAKKGYWKFDHCAFAEIKHFLKIL